HNHGADPAANIIRAKIDAMYKAEPDAKQEALDAAEAGNGRSKHQSYMHKLSTSGKSLADIQTAWHNYYVDLSDKEKHEVWQEFYAAHEQKSSAPGHEKPSSRPAAEPHHAKSAKHQSKSYNNVAEVKRHIVKRALKDSKLAKNHHVRS